MGSQGRGSSGIETIYRGITFRSRLEARWAAFFTRLDIPWEYEPFDASGYIPDFALVGDRPLLVEVKPFATIREMGPVLSRMVGRCHQIWAGDMIVLGVTPEPAAPEHGWIGNLGAPWPVAGAMVEDQGGREPLKTRYWPGLGLWNTCGKCEKVSIFHMTATYTCRPCGHYDGDHYLNPPFLDVIEDTWKCTYDDTRWKRGAPAPVMEVPVWMTWERE